jgi:hypothetical protein
VFSSNPTHDISKEGEEAIRTILRSTVLVNKRLAGDKNIRESRNLA